MRHASPAGCLVALLLGAACNAPSQPLTATPAADPPGTVRFAPLLPGTPFVSAGSAPGMPTPPASVSGTLRLPPGDGRVPAVLILHGSGGVDGRGALYADSLLGAGIASLEIDMWAARGINPARGVQERPRSVLYTIPDAYGAAAFLRAHPRIDPEAIGVMGLSYGAIMAVQLARADLQRAYASAGGPFRAFAPVYAVCSRWATGGVAAGTLDTGWPMGPTLMLEAGRDDYNARPGPAACADLLARVSAEGQRNLTLHVYPDATHGWERQGSPQTIRFFDPAAAGGRGGTVTVTADAATTANSRQRVTAFFRQSLATR